MANYSGVLFSLFFIIVRAGFVDWGGVCTIAHLWKRAEDNVVGSVLFFPSVWILGTNWVPRHMQTFAC